MKYVLCASKHHIRGNAERARDLTWRVCSCSFDRRTSATEILGRYSDYSNVIDRSERERFARDSRLARVRRQDSHRRDSLNTRRETTRTVAHMHRVPFPSSSKSELGMSKETREAVSLSELRAERGRLDNRPCRVTLGLRERPDGGLPRGCCFLVRCGERFKLMPVAPPAGRPPAPSPYSRSSSKLCSPSRPSKSDRIESLELFRSAGSFNDESMPSISHMLSCSGTNSPSRMLVGCSAGTISA